MSWFTVDNPSEKFMLEDQLLVLRRELDQAREELRTERNRFHSELAAERERNRQREEALIDRLLTRSGSRPITPPSSDSSGTAIPVKPRSPEDIARYNDFIQEEIEVKGGITPDVRSQLDELVNKW